MYEIGQNVVHSTRVVCVVRGVCTTDFVEESDKQYYLLEIESGKRKMRIYIPIVPQDVLLRRGMSKSEADTFMGRIPSIAP